MNGIVVEAIKIDLVLEHRCLTLSDLAKMSGMSTGSVFNSLECFRLGSFPRRCDKINARAVSEALKIPIEYLAGTQKIQLEKKEI